MTARIESVAVDTVSTASERVRPSLTLMMYLLHVLAWMALMTALLLLPPGTRREARRQWHEVTELRGVARLIGAASIVRRSVVAYWVAYLEQTTTFGRPTRGIARCSLLVMLAGTVYVHLGLIGSVSFAGRPPLFFLVGWTACAKSLAVYGCAPLALRLAIYADALMTTAATYTAMYRTGPRWVKIATIVGGTLGFSFGCPLYVLIAVLLANLVLWVVIACVTVFVLRVVIGEFMSSQQASGKTRTSHA